MFRFIYGILILLCKYHLAVVIFIVIYVLLLCVYCQSLRAATLFFIVLKSISLLFLSWDNRFPWANCEAVQLTDTLVLFPTASRSERTAKSFPNLKNIIDSVIHGTSFVHILKAERMRSTLVKCLVLIAGSNLHVRSCTVQGQQCPLLCIQEHGLLQPFSFQLAVW